MLSDPGSSVTPPIVSGHGLVTSHQIVLGAATLAQLHKRIGDTVDLRFVPGYPRRPIRLTIVGVATMPAIGIAEGLHTSMGIGASVPADAGPGDGEALGPQAVRLRLQRTEHGLLAGPRRSGRAAGSCGRAAAVRRGQPDPGRATAGLELRGERRLPCSACSTPPRSSTTAPWAPPRCCSPPGSRSPRSWRSGWPSRASVRRCRRDLAQLKVLGFVQRQLAAAVAWHASIAVAVGVVVGVPLGIVLGPVAVDPVRRSRSARCPHRRCRCGRCSSRPSLPSCSRTRPPCSPADEPLAPRRRSSSATKDAGSDASAA